MSELKAVHAFDVYEAYTKTGDDEQAQVYLKSEVDKVIEELKHQRDGAFGLANLGLTLDDLSQMAKKETDHQKYKRCVAMAKWCGLEQERIELIENQDITDDDFDKLVKGFYKKWRKRWLELAKKFKEAK